MGKPADRTGSVNSTAVRILGTGAGSAKGSIHYNRSQSRVRGIPVAKRRASEQTSSAKRATIKSPVGLSTSTTFLRQRPLRSHDPIDGAGGEIAESPTTSTGRLHRVDHRTCPAATRGIDRRGSACWRRRGPSRPEPILLIAHSDRTRLAKADVAIRYRETAPNYDPERSNVCFKAITIDKGTLEKGMAAADVIVEGEYRAGHQEQLYIEPNGVVAVPENGGVTLYGSLQCPYYVHRALTVLLSLPPEKVRPSDRDRWRRGARQSNRR